MFIYDEDLKTYQASDLAELERDLNVALPDTYKKFMSTYGTGEYHDVLSFYPIEDVKSQTHAYRKLWDEYPQLYWPQSNSTFTQQDAQRCFCLATSHDGDVFSYDPKTENFVIFPRHNDMLVLTDGHFADDSNWPIDCIYSDVQGPETFAPTHNLKIKEIILEKKNVGVTPEASSLENTSTYAVKIEALHETGQCLRVSVDDHEIIYSKLWAARIQLHKFSTFTGDRLSVRISYHHKNEALVEAGLKELFSTDLVIVNSSQTL